MWGDAAETKKKLIPKLKAMKYFGIQPPSNPKILKLLPHVLPAIQAEDELRERVIRQPELSPERAYSLLIVAGRPVSEAEKVRDELEAQQSKGRARW